MANHKHDSNNQINHHNQNEGNKKNNDDLMVSTTGTEKSFAQGNNKLVCYCCGKLGHKSPECKDKDKIPRDKWFQNKAQQHYIKTLEEESEDNDESSLESDVPSQRSGRSHQSRSSKKWWNRLYINMTHVES